MHPEAVALPRHHPGQVGVAYEGIGLAQFDGGLRAVLVEQTQFDASGGLGVDREIGAGAVVGGAERIRLSRPDLHGYDSSPRSPGCRADGSG